MTCDACEDAARICDGLAAHTSDAGFLACTMLASSIRSSCRHPAVTGVVVPTLPKHLSNPFLSDFMVDYPVSEAGLSFYCDGAYYRGWKEGQADLLTAAPTAQEIGGEKEGG